MMRRWKRWIAGAAVAVSLFGFGGCADPADDTADEIENELDEVEDELDEVEDEIREETP